MHQHTPQSRSGLCQQTEKYRMYTFERGSIEVLAGSVSNCAVAGAEVHCRNTVRRESGDIGPAQFGEDL